MSKSDCIELVEYTPAYLPKDRIAEETVTYIWQEYREQIKIISPSVINNHQWELISQGWVGYLPITKEFGISLLSKVPIENLFGMLEYAYRLKGFRVLEGLTTCGSLQEFYERIAHLLALRVLTRAKKGYYREYVDYSETLHAVRGRLNLTKMLTSPNRASFPCEYQEHLADIKDNQIILWTLHRIIRSGLCSERVLPTVRKAYRSLQGHASLCQCTASECLRRQYNRLNQDYEPIHGLCRFFLDQCGPKHEAGTHVMLPFLVDMARLFELFVSEWLQVYLPSRYELKSQERLQFGDAGDLRFTIDLVLYDREKRKTICVLDTKYKTDRTPAAADVHQVIAYAVAAGCQEAILLYPADEIQSFDQQVRDIRVRSLAFSIKGDLEAAGKAVLQEIIG